MSGTMMLLGAGVALALLTVVGLTLRSTLCLATPSEVLVLSGTRRRVGGSVVGYRAVHGGRGVRIPLLEKVDVLDVSSLSLSIERVDVTRDQLRLRVVLEASVRPATEEPMLQRALECLLGRSRDELRQLVEPIAVGALVGVAREVTAAQIVCEPAAVVEQLREEQEHVLGRLGLRLDSLQLRVDLDAFGYERALTR